MGGMNERLPVSPGMRQEMIAVARAFRKTPTRSEALLWQALRRREPGGVRFRRQQPIGPFVVDFYCAARRLIVEVDGPIHDTQADHDQARQRLLECCGYQVLRFTTTEVESSIQDVIDSITTVVEGTPNT